MAHDPSEIPFFTRLDEESALLESRGEPQAADQVRAIARFFEAALPKSSLQDNIDRLLHAVGMFKNLDRAIVECEECIDLELLVQLRQAADANRAQNSLDTAQTLTDLATLAEETLLRSTDAPIGAGRLADTEISRHVARLFTVANLPLYLQTYPAETKAQTARLLDVLLRAASESRQRELESGLRKLLELGVFR